jgi:hypothetical protein
MARRPETETILSREQLDEFKSRLSMLSIPGIEGIYRTAHNDCRYDGKHLPSAAAIQQLVGAWKVLRRFYRRSEREHERSEHTNQPHQSE